MDSFDNVSKFFEQQRAEEAGMDVDICGDCGVRMETSEREDGAVVCPGCGVMRQFEAFEPTERVNSKFSVGVGPNRRYLNLTQSYQPVQLNNLVAYFTARHREYKGEMTIPATITAIVAKTYNELQKLTADGIINASYRGNVKDQILAALIYFTCLKHGIARSRREVKEFMGLDHTSGITQGEAIVRGLNANGHIDVVVTETAGIRAARYLEALKIPTGVEFIADCVSFAEDNFLCVQSQLNSKVVGALWLFIRYSRINVTDDEIEAVAGTRRSTFMKFVSLVMSREYFPAFVPIFERNHVPLV
jgi:hypothetical protein